MALKFERKAQMYDALFSLAHAQCIPRGQKALVGAELDLAIQVVHLMRSSQFLLDIEGERMTNTTPGLHLEEYDIYYVNPDVPHAMYIGACVFMACVCCFGILSNSGVVVLFCNSPLVSSSKRIMWYRLVDRFV